MVYILDIKVPKYSIATQVHDSGSLHFLLTDYSTLRIEGGGARLQPPPPPP